MNGEGDVDGTGRCGRCGAVIAEGWKVFCPGCYTLEVEERGGRKPVIGLEGLVPDDSWLWCLHCERFFQAKDYAQKLGAGFGGKCPFCGASGLGIDIYPWCQCEEFDHWPKSESELSYGQHCSMYPRE